MTAAMVQAALLRLLQRLAEVAPVAWRHDPLFRGAAIGAGVTFVLLLLRVAGPHNPALERPGPQYLPVGTPSVRVQPSLRDVLPPPAVAPPAPAVVPSIAPSHPLGDATVLPAPSIDHFGTFTPGKHP